METNTQTPKAKFGLFTTISMIAGIVIGSGIFFKTDDVLYATDGNVLMGVLLWSVGAIGIIFGGLCISRYAMKNDTVGGLITYCEDAWGKRFGYMAGWFQTVFYYPALIAILCWISGMYIGLIFNITDPFSLPVWLMTITILIVFFLLNVLATAKAGAFQNITLVLKISALLILTLIGLCFGQAANLSASAAPAAMKTGLFTGLIACAFSFDGWFIAPSIAHEIRDPKKNLSKALVIVPLLILTIYLAYFIGINYLLGPAQIMQLGDSSVGYIASSLVGGIGSKIVYCAVSLSVLGTVNGIVLGYIRLPYALALRREIIGYRALARLDQTRDIPLNSALLCFILSSLWLLLHFFSSLKLKLGFLDFSSLSIDSIPIVLTYLFYASLYLKLILDGRRDPAHRSWRYHLLYPLLALAGAILVLIGGLQGSGWIYLVISVIGILAGILVRPKQPSE